MLLACVCRLCNSRCSGTADVDFPHSHLINAETASVSIRLTSQINEGALKWCTFARSGITHVAATLDVQSHKFVPHWVVSATEDVQRRQTVRQSYATVPMSQAGRSGSEDLMPLSSLQQ